MYSLYRNVRESTYLQNVRLTWGPEDSLKVIHGLPNELATTYPQECFKARVLGLGHPIQSLWDSILAGPLTLAPGVGSVGGLWGFIFPRLLFLGPHPPSVKLGFVGKFP